MAMSDTFEPDWIDDLVEVLGLGPELEGLLEGLACATQESLDMARAAFSRFHRAGGAGTLDLSGMEITALPPAFFGHPKTIFHLTHLNCARNELTSLPASLGLLSKLARFQCDGNQLTALPAELARLAALRALSCDNNELTALPPGLGGLAALESLTCAGNRLEALPAGLGQAAALRELRCDRNGLTVIPAELGAIAELEVLECSDNQLEDFWKELTEYDESNYGRLGASNLAIVWRARWEAWQC